jgi:hypothetical protein
MAYKLVANIFGAGPNAFQMIYNNFSNLFGADKSSVITVSLTLWCITMCEELDAKMRGDIISINWGDHVEWGEGKAKLDTPEQIAAGVRRWKTRYSATKLFWRGASRFIQRYTRTFYRDETSPPRKYYIRIAQITMDEFQAICDAAHAEGLPVYLYHSIFDEGWPIVSGWDDRSPTWQSNFTIAHPEYLECDRSGTEVNYGVLCYAYPEARSYQLNTIRDLLGSYPFDGLFLCTRCTSKPVLHADQFGFNEPIVAAYEQRYGVNILEHDFDVEAWRRLRGEFLTQLLREVRAFTRERGLRLAVGLPQGNYVGPPVGNLHLDWRTWVAAEIMDELVINQVATRCPSNWTTIWPGHSGYGYVQNYDGNIGLLPLEMEVRANYGPYCTMHGCQLYISRLHWSADERFHAQLLALPGVTGLVLSSFRLDNQTVIQRNGLDREAWGISS